MAHQLRIQGIPMPKVYVTDNDEERIMLRNSGIPVILWKDSDDTLVKMLFLPALRRLLPDIDWGKVLKVDVWTQPTVEVPEGHFDRGVVDVDGEASVDPTERVADIAAGSRCIEGSLRAVVNEPLDAFIDLDNVVSLDVLQELCLLPKWMDDVVDSIRKNLESYCWEEGFDKKHQIFDGEWTSMEELPNLLIIDISGSIPFGISRTMLTLADMLRQDCNADLIVTGATSMFWSRDEELPSPQWIRSHIARGNENWDFYNILKNDCERRYGNVVSFGDNDTFYVGTKILEDCGLNWDSQSDVYALFPEVDHVMHMHTWQRKPTGYAKWCIAVNPGVVEEFDCSWAKVIK